MGVPTIVLDPVSPSWTVACHDFSQVKDAIEGSACRPDRTQWLADIAYR